MIDIVFNSAWCLLAVVYIVWIWLILSDRSKSKEREKQHSDDYWIIKDNIENIGCRLTRINQKLDKLMEEKPTKEQTLNE